MRIPSHQWNTFAVLVTLWMLGMNVLLYAEELSPTVQETPSRVPVIQVQQPPSIEDDYEIVPAALPTGWQTCDRVRLGIAYINSLPKWQRFFLSPYRSLESLRYYQCAKALFPETQEFLEVTYPLPYSPIDPQSSVRRRTVSPQPTPSTSQPKE